MVDILDTSNIESLPEYAQLKEKFNNDPALQEEHGNFETYWKRAKKSVAMRFVKNKYNQQTSVINNHDDGSRGSSRKTSRDAEEKLDYKIRISPSAQIYGAASPVGSPTRKLSDAAEELTEYKLKEFWEGVSYQTIDENGQQVTVTNKGAVDRLEELIGKDIITNNQFSVNVGTSSNGNLNPRISFKNRAGQTKSVDLLSGEAMIIRDELPPELAAKWHDVITGAHQMNTEYVELAQTKEQLANFRKAALVKEFGQTRGQEIFNNGI